MAEGSLTVRAALREDYPRLRAVLMDTLALHHQARPDVFCLTDTPPPSEEFITDLLSQGHGALFMAEYDTHVVGFLTIRASTADQPYLMPVRFGIIDNVGVVAAQRRHGIGRALMLAAHAWAREQGLPQVRLSVWEFNTEARAFYEALGYATATRSLWTNL